MAFSVCVLGIEIDSIETLKKSIVAIQSISDVFSVRRLQQKENLNQFNNSSLANKIVHPVKSFRLHRQLAKDVKKSKETLDKIIKIGSNIGITI